MTNSIKTFNPASGKLIKEYSCLSDEQLEAIIVDSNDAFKQWKAQTVEFRLKFLNSLRELLREKRLSLANLIVLEMGKPIKDALAEIDKCAVLCDYYYTHSELALRDKPLRSSFKSSYIQYAPKGIILGIMPWNFPFWQAFRFAVPAIVSGNTVLLKHAPNTTECNLVMEYLFRLAGFPKNVYNAIVVDVKQVESVIASPYVQGVSLTGSERAGSAVGSLAGKYIKTSILELGGNDACLITDTADIGAAVKAAITSRMMNTGQTCISTKRIFIHKSKQEESIKHALNHLSIYGKGELTSMDTKMGYMAREDLAGQIEDQYNQFVNHGAQVLKPLERQGNYISPALLLLKEGDRFMVDQELFGPVALMYPYSSLDDVITEINASPYGLGASVWSEDLDLAARIASEIDAGCVAINDFVKSDVSLPFGGTKRSGYGRELHTDALLAFTNQKTIYRS